MLMSAGKEKLEEVDFQDVLLTYNKTFYYLKFFYLLTCSVIGLYIFGFVLLFY